MNESLTEILTRRLAAKNVPLTELPTTIGALVVETLIDRASKGDVAAIHEIWERMTSPEPGQFIDGYVNQNGREEDAPLKGWESSPGCRTLLGHSGPVVTKPYLDRNAESPE